MSWSFDTAHSEIAFSVRHMMFAKVRGAFGRWSGEVLGDGAIEGVRVDVAVDSIDTREAQRDGHLRSADFFDVANHPTMSFRSTALRGDPEGAFTLEGELSIRGNTRPVSLQAEFTGGGKDPWGNSRRGYRARARLNRKDFGLSWNAALEMGGVLVGEEVEVEVEVQLVRQG